MKKFAICIFLLPTLVQAQTIFPFTDFNNFFQVFRDGYFQQIEHNQVSDVFYGDEIVAYCNSQRDFKVYDGEQTRMLTNQIITYKASDHLLAWNIGPIINYFENGQSRIISSFGGQYEVSDSLIVYQDTRYNTVNVVYKGKAILLYQTTSDLYMPEVVGDNIVAFRDNGNNYKVFWRGEIYELGVWNGANKIQFSAGTDMLAFNDPNSRTFAVFENGEFLDVEDLHVSKMKACRGFVVYEDVQGNLKYYGKGVRKDLSAYFQFWDAKDDVVIWGESNSTYSLYGGDRKQVCNYIPKDWLLKNDVVAFRSNVGGVASWINGNFKEITTLANVEYAVNKHSVMVTLPNRSVIVLWKGELYRD